MIHFEAVADTDEPSASQQEQNGGQVMLRPSHHLQSKALVRKPRIQRSDSWKSEQFLSDLDETYQGKPS